MIPIQELRLLRCGVCLRCFCDETTLRRHIAKPDASGDTHDGEPWASPVVVRPGQLWRWAPGTHAESLAFVEDMVWNVDGEAWLKLSGCWNTAARFAEALGPAPMVPR